MGGNLRRVLVVPLLLGAAVAAACDNDDETGPVERREVTGFWEGATNGRDTSAVVRFQLLLVEDNEDNGDQADDEDNVDDVNGIDEDDLEEGDIEGSGTIRGPTSSVAVLVEGNVLFPDISLTLITQQFADGRELINFTGEFVGEDLIVGKLNGGGFNDVKLRLRRTERPLIDP